MATSTGRLQHCQNDAYLVGSWLPGWNSQPAACPHGSGAIHGKAQKAWKGVSD